MLRLLIGFNGDDLINNKSTVVVEKINENNEKYAELHKLRYRHSLFTNPETVMTKAFKKYIRKKISPFRSGETKLYLFVYGAHFVVPLVNMS